MAKSKIKMRDLTPLEEETLHALGCAENYFRNLSFERQLTDPELYTMHKCFEAIDKITFEPKKLPKKK